jgi:hypothetical protein
VVRRAYLHLLALRAPWRGTIDDEYCAAWRNAMVAAGATERDIDVLAVYQVLLVSAETERGSFDRQGLWRDRRLYRKGSRTLVILSESAPT